MHHIRVFDYRQLTGSAEEITQTIHNDLCRWMSESSVLSVALIKSDEFHPHSPIGELVKTIRINGMNKKLVLTKELRNFRWYIMIHGQ